MNVVGNGVDIVENKRIQKSIIILFSLYGLFFYYINPDFLDLGYLED